MREDITTKDGDVVEQPACFGRCRNPSQPFDDLEFAHRLSLRRTRFLRNAVKKTIHEPALLFVVKGVSDVDIFRDYRSDRDIAARDQLIGACTKERAHRPIK